MSAKKRPPVDVKLLADVGPCFVQYFEGGMPEPGDLPYLSHPYEDLGPKPHTWRRYTVVVASATPETYTPLSDDAHDAYFFMT